MRERERPMGTCALGVEREILFIKECALAINWEFDNTHCSPFRRNIAN